MTLYLHCDFLNAFLLRLLYFYCIKIDSKHSAVPANINKGNDLRLVGNEKQPVLIMDGFLRDPQPLMRYAAAKAQFQRATNYYPGVRAPCPGAYTDIVRNFLSPEILEIFDIPHTVELRFSSCFAIVTKRPSEPTLQQSNSLFAEIESVAPSLNRAVIYRGSALHSGSSGPKFPFDQSPNTGRLTVTSFCHPNG